MIKRKFKECLDYIQPTDYIVSSDQYSDLFKTPVLTAGQSFFLGYTNDTNGIYNASEENPIILFDDFTTAIKWVDFPFKVKSSACKILVPKNNVNLRYLYYAIKTQKIDHSQHKRYWISEFSELLFNDYGNSNIAIANSLDNIQQAINNKKKEIILLNELIKSRFIEMFGNPNLNDKLFPQHRFDTICENLDNRRIPIASKDRKQGRYPYYGASGIVDYVDNYIFDEDVLLISEDGANLVVRSTPIAFSVSGKVWVNNHAHVVKFKNFATQKYTEYYFAYIDISEYITGSAQPKFNQAKLNSLRIPIPPIELQNKFATFVEQIDKSKFIIQRQIKELQELLDKKMDEYFSE